MTALDRVTLRAQFQNGDTPQGSDYANMIDSAANLAETSAQTFLGPVTFNGGFGVATLSATTLVVDAIRASGAISGVSIFGTHEGPVNGTVSGTVNPTGGTATGLMTFAAGLAVSGLLQLQTAVSVACISTAQASARLLDGANVFILQTVATASNDSVRLPGGYPTAVQFIINNTTASAKLFPPTGGTIDGGSANAARDLFPSSRVVVFHVASGTFFTLRGT